MNEIQVLKDKNITTVTVDDKIYFIGIELAQSDDFTVECNIKYSNKIKAEKLSGNESDPEHQKVSEETQRMVDDLYKEFLKQMRE